MAGSKWCSIGAVVFVQQGGRSDVWADRPPGSPADGVVSVGSVVALPPASRTVGCVTGGGLGGCL